MNNTQHSGGFTLIEVMITIVIIGILAAIAYPTYIGQVRQSRRTDAKTMLLKTANRQERYYTTKHAYADKMTDLGFADEKVATDNGAYEVTITSADDTSFALQASAAGDQTNDICTAYGLNQLGQKTANGQSASDSISKQCW